MIHFIAAISTDLLFIYTKWFQFGLFILFVLICILLYPFPKLSWFINSGNLIILGKINSNIHSCSKTYQKFKHRTEVCEV